MKKTFIAVLASLMVAGAISAASGLTTTKPSPESVVMIGDGTSPIFTSSAYAVESGDSLSHDK
jgi:hypothetical protein